MGIRNFINLPSTEHDSLNVISKHSKIAANLSANLMLWLKNVNAKFPTEDLEFDTLKAQSRYSKTINKKRPALEKHRMEVISKDFQPNENWWKSKVTID